MHAAVKEIVTHCQLEWDRARGVLYVHNKKTGATVLRVCGLDTSPAMGHVAHGMIDITIRGSEVKVGYPND